MNRHVMNTLRPRASSKSFSTAAIIRQGTTTTTRLLDHHQQSYHREPVRSLCGSQKLFPSATAISLQQQQQRQLQQQLLQQHQQIRHFASDRRLRRNKRRKLDPFKVLKVRRKTPYADVKKIFLKLAMQHHPDVAGAKSEEEQEKSREMFIKARQAFEALAEDPETGGICLVEELPDYVADDEHDKMDEWFKQETGFDMPFMDEETMKEVAAMTEAVGGGGMDRGLDRDGGMWDLARMVTRTVKSGGDGKNLLRLEAGDVKETAINNSNLRAKRRRAR